MGVFSFKQDGEDSVITVQYDLNGVATIHHVKTFTTGVGDNRISQLMADDYYKRQPRGSDGDVWSLLSAGTYRPMAKSHVPWEVSKSWVLSINPIRTSENDNKQKKTYVDVDTVADYLNRTGRQRNFDA